MLEYLPSQRFTGGVREVGPFSLWLRYLPIPPLTQANNDPRQGIVSHSSSISLPSILHSQRTTHINASPTNRHIPTTLFQQSHPSQAHIPARILSPPRLLLSFPLHSHTPLTLPLKHPPPALRRHRIQPHTPLFRTTAPNTHRSGDPATITAGNSYPLSFTVTGTVAYPFGTSCESTL